VYEYTARLTRVVDGDTVWLSVDLGFGVHVNLDFRLYGIDTPEVVGPTRTAGLAAKAELERLLALGSLRIVTYKADKYGRWLAELFITQPGSIEELNVNRSLLKDGFAKPYFGQGPKT
jgi:endonuclease YncB( thermonuclease family)